MKLPFNILALGVKFRYASPPHSETATERVWVKISHNEIAAWDASQIATNWTGQSICCFSDDDSEESLSEEVEVVDEVLGKIAGRV